MLLSLAGCSKRDEISHYSAPKDPQLITWAVPEGWRKIDHEPKLQYAAFATDGTDDAAKVTVSFLSPEGPGAMDLLMNVNRWRGQLGLPPSTAADVGAQVINTSQAQKTMQVVDLASADGRRMRAIIVPREDRIWFFKMTGNGPQVDAQKDAFDAFVRDTKYIAPAAPALVASTDSKPSPQMPEGLPPMQTPIKPASHGEFTYSLPPGWSVDPTPHAMRMLTVTTGGDKPAAMIVTRLSTNFGGMLLNINRWRGEVGMPPIEEETAVKDKPVQIGSVTGKMIDLEGPGKDAATPMRSLIARCTQGESVWFFKLLGPAESVEAQRQAFSVFLTSVQLP